MSKQELKPLRSRWWQREKESSRPTRAWGRSSDDFDSIKIESNDQNRRAYRDMLLRPRVSRRPSAA